MVGVERGGVNLQFRVAVALGIVGALMLVLVLRLWSLQVLRNEYYMTLSEQNRLREVYIPPTRGIIMDRHGRVLAKNRPSFNVEFVAEDCPEPERVMNDLAELLSMDPTLLRTRSMQAGRRRKFEPRLLAKDVTRDQIARVAANRYRLPGVVINVVPTREYVYGEFAAHVLGYIREITRGQLDQAAYAEYRQGDQIGQYGLEARWERELQGRRGIQHVVVNAMGTRTGEASFQSDIPGKNLTLTLDYDLQRAAEEALHDQKGAIVAMDARSGEVLALSSHPGFDPNIFAGEIDTALWRDLTTGPGRRLNNRAVQGVYPPGSVFKVFMSVAGLAEAVIDPRERVECPGYLPFGGRNFRCHKRSGHGSVALYEALVQSCDVYYYTLGNRLGVDRIHDYATRFGLGRPTELELTDEARGLIPSSEWKRRANARNPANQRWFPGETLSVAIGQGAVTTTPLQITRGIAALVNGGKVMKPYLVREVASPDGGYRDADFAPEVLSTIELDPKIVHEVVDAMVGVVNDKHGTGRRAQLKGVPLPVGADGGHGRKEGEEQWLYPPITVAGKTGTAQVISLDATTKHDAHEDHAWFSAFAPAENPEIVVTALIENGGHGGVTAAPAVQQVMTAYFYRGKEEGGAAPTGTPLSSTEMEFDD